MPWTVYCHVHVESGRRYVGLTKYTMMHRWNQHCAQAKRSKDGRSHFQNAIRKYGKEAFEHEILGTCETLEAANSAEKEWIEKLGTKDPAKGFNLMKGGGSQPHPLRKNPWDDPKYREKATTASRRTWSDPVRRAAASATHTGIKLSDHHRARISEARMGRDHSLDVRERITAKVRKTYEKEEVRNKNRLSSTENWKDPAYRLKVSTALSIRFNEPEMRAKLSERSKAMWLVPGYRESRPRALMTDTLKFCRKHGWIPLSECYPHPRSGKMRYECRQCVLAQPGRGKVSSRRL